MENLKYVYKHVHKELKGAEGYMEKAKEFKEKGDTRKAEHLYMVAQQELVSAEKLIQLFEAMREDYDDVAKNPLFDFQVECMLEEYAEVKEKLSKR